MFHKLKKFIVFFWQRITEVDEKVTWSIVKKQREKMKVQAKKIEKQDDHLKFAKESQYKAQLERDNLKKQNVNLQEQLDKEKLKNRKITEALEKVEKQHSGLRSELEESIKILPIQFLLKLMFTPICWINSSDQGVGPFGLVWFEKNYR